MKDQRVVGNGLLFYLTSRTNLFNVWFTYFCKFSNRKRYGINYLKQGQHKF